MEKSELPRKPSDSDSSWNRSLIHAIFGAVSFFVFFQRDPMDSILLAVVSIALLVLGYRFYSPRVARWLELDYDRKTPAVEMNDGVDYVPARHWAVLFGHHFASIAGAAPIIGPVIACLYWGWLPAIAWIVIGGIFFGAVHDFTALILSVKHKGHSIAALTESILGKTPRILFSMFVFLALILVVAVFAAVAGTTLASTPAVVIPTFGLIVVAVMVGFLMYHVRLPVWLCSIVGLVLLFALIWIGYKWPIELPIGAETPAEAQAIAARWWTVILLIYGLVASVTPVTILLQPRDHLAAGVLVVGMFIGFMGLLVGHPTIKAPPFVRFSSDAGWLWPMLFVTVACGAVSGFHSLVASGTTSKQLSKMRHARPIGYGGMIMESVLSLLAVLAVTAGLYWMSPPEGIEGPVYQEVFKGGNWIKAFGTGYGEITKRLLDFIGLGALGSLIGITMLKTFVMTTLDSATRITRYICDELFGEAFHIKLMKNKYATTLVVGVLAGTLALGNWKAIWPMFGASNQLIASLVFIVASAHLMSRGKNCIFTAVPAIIMLVTTLGALVYQTYGFMTADEPKIMLAAVAVILFVLAVFMLVQSLIVITRRKHGTGRSEPTDLRVPLGD